jgi:centrosomal CEP192-like protein/ASPM-SPD-2-Hydin domain-containing protein
VDPQISISSASIAFGDQVLNTTAPYQTITVSNPGTTTLHVGLSVAGDYPDLYTATNTCVGGTGTAPGSSCTIQVGFMPHSLGPKSATLSITSDAPTSPTTVPLSGNGVDAAPTLSPSSLSFANQLVNTSSASQMVSLMNTNSAPLQINSISITGDFSQSNNCGASVAANSSCAIQVTFHPTATGTRAGTISISSNSVPSSTAVSLSGTGIQPAISISPGTVAFGDQVLGTISSAQTITVSNPGTATLHVNSNMTFSGDPDFSIVSNNCAGTAGVAPGASCAIQVNFIPQLLGTRSGTLTITSDAPTTPTSVGLSGNGVNPAPTLSPTSLSFGDIFVDKTSGGKTVKLTANGPAALTISSISVSAGFIQTNNCPATLSGGTSCNINVSFKPLAAGAAAGTLSIIDNGLGSPQTVALSGNSLDFSVSASPSSATVTAGQKASYTVTVSPLGGSYNSNVALSCSGGLPTGVKCSFSPSGVSPGSSSINSALTVSTTSGSTGTQPGSYTININGTANGTTHSTTVGLVVN